MPGEAAARYETALEDAAAARARLEAAVHERARIDAVLDRGEASFTELARANALVRRARVRAAAADHALQEALAAVEHAEAVAAGGIAADAPLTPQDDGAAMGQAEREEHR